MVFHFGSWSHPSNHTSHGRSINSYISTFHITYINMVKFTATLVAALLFAGSTLAAPIFDPADNVAVTARELEEMFDREMVEYDSRSPRGGGSFGGSGSHTGHNGNNYNTHLYGRQFGHGWGGYGHPHRHPHHLTPSTDDQPSAREFVEYDARSPRGSGGSGAGSGSHTGHNGNNYNPHIYKRQFGHGWGSGHPHHHPHRPNPSNDEQPAAREFVEYDARSPTGSSGGSRKHCRKEAGGRIACSD
ncbi:hypothetical protein D9619_011088 [Psilocybe cf. subviscida]|uniref:Uncharacterized protein n=1 Tax=Psilocybe cf. subviscida TaxID=2480587 RepID=A0A8H5F5I3_9AGAR|nr:hypothetical protein D9619_011088 [Psilocybe cf. subviscida]